MDTTTETPKLTPQQRYYLKNKETVKEKIKISRLLRKPDKTPTTTPDDTVFTDDTIRRIHFFKFRRALKSIKNTDALYNFYEDIWIKRYKAVILEFIDKLDDYAGYKQALIDRTKARCDRCKEIFNKRADSGQFTCGFCLLPKPNGICYITMEE